MSRPLLILVVILVLIVVALIALASLDHEVPLTHVEQPVANATAH